MGNSEPGDLQTCIFDAVPHVCDGEHAAADAEYHTARGEDSCMPRPGRKTAPTKDEVLEVLRDASFGTDPAVSMIESVEKLYAVRGL